MRVERSRYRSEAAEIMKIPSFNGVVLTPMALAASSFPWMARRALPIRE